MKELKNILTAAAAQASADTVNAEGAPAWSIRDEDRLVQLAMTGTMGNAFYATAREVAADAVRLLERAEPRAALVRRTVFRWATKPCGGIRRKAWSPIGSCQEPKPPRQGRRVKPRFAPRAAQIAVLRVGSA